MFLKIYLLIILIILFICHLFRKKAEFRKYKELISKENNIEFLETRTFEVIDKYEESNMKKFGPTNYIIKLKSTKRKETYEEELKVSWGTYLKTKIGENKNYDIYTQIGSNEILLIDTDKKNKKRFFFDEIKLFLVTEYVLLAVLIITLISFGILQFIL